MEHQLWLAIIAVLSVVNKSAKAPKRDGYSDANIVKVYYWAVVHDRPTSWACQSRNWPLWLRRTKFPSPSTMSRRLRSPLVQGLLNAMEQHIAAPKQGLFWIIDGKPLAISGCSKDRQAGYGRAANCKAKGYKIHAIINASGDIAAWRLAPMNKDERVMAKRLVSATPLQGYLIADGNYDSNPLHELCSQRGLQLVTRRRHAGKRAVGHHKHAAGRLRSIALTEGPFTRFADGLLHGRDAIERYYAHVTNWGGGLTCLPPWVRTHRRVHRWVQAKLVLTALKQSLPEQTYVA